MRLDLPPKCQYRGGGPGLWWQIVPRPHCSHRKRAVTESWSTGWRHQHRWRVDRAQMATSSNLSKSLWGSGKPQKSMWLNLLEFTDLREMRTKYGVTSHHHCITYSYEMICGFFFTMDLCEYLWPVEAYYVSVKYYNIHWALKNWQVASVVCYVRWSVKK